MKIVLGIVALLLSFSSNAADQVAPLPLQSCIKHAPYGFAETRKLSVTPICRTGYYTVHDNIGKIALYTSYVLRPEHATGCMDRDNSFEIDRSLPPLVRAGNKDYAKSGYDIGHMANAADLKYSQEAQASAALLSNAAPQLPEFNRGIWKKLEDTTRGWAITRQHPLLIQLGTIYSAKADKTIGKGRVGVPHAFYKVITDTVTSEVQVFLFKHEGSKADLSTFITSIEEVQRQAGMKLSMPTKPIFTKLWPIELKSARSAKSAACGI